MPADFIRAYQLASLPTASFQPSNETGMGSFKKIAFCIALWSLHQNVLMVP